MAVWSTLTLKSSATLTQPQMTPPVTWVTSTPPLVMGMSSASIRLARSLAETSCALSAVTAGWARAPSSMAAVGLSAPAA